MLVAVPVVLSFAIIRGFFVGDDLSHLLGPLGRRPGMRHRPVGLEVHRGRPEQFLARAAAAQLAPRPEPPRDRTLDSVAPRPAGAPLPESR